MKGLLPFKYWVLYCEMLQKGVNLFLMTIKGQSNLMYHNHKDLFCTNLGYCRREMLRCRELWVVLCLAKCGTMQNHSCEYSMTRYHWQRGSAEFTVKRSSSRKSSNLFQVVYIESAGRVTVLYFDYIPHFWPNIF